METQARREDDGVLLLITPRDSMVPKVARLSYPEANKLHEQLGKILVEAGVTMRSPL